MDMEDTTRALTDIAQVTMDTLTLTHTHTTLTGPTTMDPTVKGIALE